VDEAVGRARRAGTVAARVLTLLGPVALLVVAPCLAAASPDPTPGPACSVTGRVTGPGGRAVPGLSVRLNGAGLSDVTTVTGADGRYRFPSPARFGSGYDPIGGLADRGGSSFDPGTETVTVSVHPRDPEGLFEFRHTTAEGSVPAEVRTVPFRLTRDATCVRDVDLATLRDTGHARPAEPARWADLVVLFEQARQGYAFATSELGFRPDLGLPLWILPWCVESADITCPSGEQGGPPPLAFYRADGEHPSIPLLPQVSDGQVGCPDDTLLHEIGHAVLGDANGRGNPSAADRHPHAGYYGNSSSNDSWIEGWATFFAVQVRQRRFGRSDPHLVLCGPRGRSVIDLETNHRVWDGLGRYEEFAAAGLLLDLVDSTQDHPSARIQDVVRTVVLRPATGPPIVVGRVLRHGRDAISVRVEFLDPDGTPVHDAAAWVFPDGTFRVPAPPGLDVASVRVAEFAGCLPGDDDEPVRVGVGELWKAVTEYHSVDTRGGRRDTTMVFDLADLYAAVTARFSGDRDLDGVDDIDQVFVDHGVFADPDRQYRHVTGAEIGMTTRRPLGVGPAAVRYTTEVAAGLPVRIRSTVPTTVIAFVDRPSPRESDSYAYQITPGPTGVSTVVVPPEGSGATVSLLAVAPGHLPEVVATFDSATTWAGGRVPAGRDPQVLRIALRPGSVPLATGAGTGAVATVGTDGTDGTADTAGTGDGARDGGERDGRAHRVAERGSDAVVRLPFLRLSRAQAIPLGGGLTLLTLFAVALLTLTPLDRRLRVTGTGTSPDPSHGSAGDSPEGTGDSGADAGGSREEAAVPGGPPATRPGASGGGSATC